jgi:hypothetical protein
VGPHAPRGRYYKKGLYMSTFEQRTTKPVTNYPIKETVPVESSDTVENEKSMIGTAVDKIVNIVKGKK